MREACPRGQQPAALVPALLLAAATGLAGGCAGTGFDLERLPAEPIAFVYRTTEEAEKRAELLHPDRREQRRTSRPGVSILEADRVRELLSRETREDALMRSLGRLSLLDPRTGDPSPLASARPGDRPLEWSADHRRLRFVSFRSATPQVLEYDLEERELRQLTRSGWNHLAASVGPDGRLAFDRGGEGGEGAERRIYVEPPGGGPPRPVSPGPLDFGPVWSPDGELLVFGTLLEGAIRAIGAVVPDSGESPRILGRGRDPVFTPDGQWIVYSRKVRDRWRLWRMRPTGIGKRTLGGGPLRRADEVHPAVSPDGGFVAYVAQEEGRESLRVRRFDGGGDRPLLEGGDGASPVW